MAHPEQNIRRFQGPQGPPVALERSRTLTAFAMQRLGQLERAPQMWAATCEAFVVQCACALELLEGSVVSRSLYYQIFAVPNTNQLSGMELPLTDEFALRVLDRVAELIHG